MIVYITRPDAYEVYMGGKRRLELWLQEPYYDHRPHHDGMQWVDRGWTAPHCDGQPARLLLAQDERLLNTVMEFVITSVYPKGMDLDKGTYWAEHGNNGQPAWRSLFEDREWEAKCNTCYKRFLLKVDLRHNTVEKVTPYVVLDGAYFTTADITPELASQIFHDPDSKDIIPF